MSVSRKGDDCVRRKNGMTVFYFTSTGNSLAVARRIGGKLISIPQIIDSGNLNFKDDVIGIVFPVYWITVPEIVRRFMQKAKLEAAYIFAIGTNGGSPGSAMVDARKLAKKNGYRLDYAVNIIMADNYFPLYDLKKEIDRLPGKKIDEKISRIVEDIGKRKHELEGASVVWRFFSALIVRFKKFDNFAKKYTINDQCNKCGVCKKVCPANNISVDDKVVFGSRCMGCLACSNLCPQNAIHLKNEKNGQRWRNPDVSLNEIIEANNRGGRQG